MRRSLLVGDDAGLIAHLPADKSTLSNCKGREMETKGAEEPWTVVATLACRAQDCELSGHIVYKPFHAGLEGLSTQ